MYKSQIVTPWIAAIGNSSLTGNHPQLLDDYPTIRSFEDGTGQPSANIMPAPNEYTVEIICAPEVLFSIESDPDYEVLWSEEIEEEAPP